MVAGAGFEPATDVITIFTKIGQREPCLGQKEAQVGQPDEVGPDGGCTGRTDPGPGSTIPGLDGSTTGAQLESAGGCGLTTDSGAHSSGSRQREELDRAQ